MNLRQKATLYHEMGKMLGAGLNLERSTDILLDQRPPSGVRRYLQGLQQGLHEHLTASGAIARHNPKLAGGLEIHLVEAGERGGRLAEAFQHLASYFDLRQRARNKAIRALLYPLILLHMGLMLPDLSKIVTGAGWQTVINEGIARVLIAWVAIACLAVAWLMLSKASEKSPAIDGALRLLPLIGPLRRHWAMARFCQVMEMALMAALKMSDAVRLAGSSSQSAQLNHAANEAAQDIERNGDALSLSLRRAGHFPRSFVNAAETAEVSGTLDVEMERYAKAETELAASALDRAAEWLPRIAYFLVVIYVAYRIIDSYAGMLGADMKILDGGQ